MIDQLPLPLSRTSDPLTSRLAAEEVKPGNSELVRAIRQYVIYYGPSTSWEIAQGVAGTRWQFDSCRTACARAGLQKIHGAGVSPGGRPACLYYVETENVDMRGLT